MAEIVTFSVYNLQSYIPSNKTNQEIITVEEDLIAIVKQQQH